MSSYSDIVELLRGSNSAYSSNDDVLLQVTLDGRENSCAYVLARHYYTTPSDGLLPVYKSGATITLMKELVNIRKPIPYQFEPAYETTSDSYSL